MNKFELPNIRIGPVDPFAGVEGVARPPGRKIWKTHNP